MQTRTLLPLLPLLLPIAALAQATASPQLIRDVRVFDGKQVIEHRNVLIENGKVTQVGGLELAAKAEIIEGKNRTLVPGFIDAHVHLPDDPRSAAAQALRLGVTTQLDMFSAGDRLKAVKSLEAEDGIETADVRTAGVGATAPGGHPTQMGGPSFPTINETAQAQTFVDDRISEGSDFIKIVHDDGSTWPWTHKPVSMLDIAIMRALVQAAHKRGKIAVVHVLSEQQARDAIEAGADGLAHLFLGDTVDPGFAKLAARHHVFVIPTLATLYLNCGRSAGPATLADANLAPFIAENWKRSLSAPQEDPSANHLCLGADRAVRDLAAAGVPLLTGTDAPAPGTTYGASVHTEMALLVADGLSPVQALAAATSVPAQSFLLSDRGWIRPGMRADLVLVEGDPATDIRATRRIVAVWKHGVRVQR